MLLERRFFRFYNVLITCSFESLRIKHFKKLFMKKSNLQGNQLPVLFLWRHGQSRSSGKPLIHALLFIRTEVRGDFNIHGTKYFLVCCFPSKIKKLWCCKPPVPLVGQKTRPLHGILTRLVITEKSFSGVQHTKNIWFCGC